MPGPGGGAAAPGGQAMPAPRRALRSAEEGASSSSAPRELEGRGGGVAGSGSAALPAAVRAALELAEARRRLLEAEGRRQLVSELESRAQQLHRVFREAELRLAGRAESLGRLGSGAAQAELYLAAHGQRLKKSLRRYKSLRRPPALLASALRLGGCVPWAAGRLRRARGGAPDPPESPFRRGLPPTGDASPPPPPPPSSRP